MGKVIFVLVIAVLVVTTILGSCAPSTQTIQSVAVDNQSVKPQSPAVVDNKTVIKPVALPPKPDYQEKIVFWSLRDARWNWNWSMNWDQLEDSNYEIYIMDADGKNQVRLTNNSDWDLMPSLSPDGTKILFVSNRKWEADNKFNDSYNVYIMDVDGGNVKNLVGLNNRAYMPSWSPDGLMVVFCADLEGWNGIWVTDAKGKNFLNLTPLRNSEESDFPIWPVWSPDGKKILYTSAQDGRYDVNFLDIDYELVKQVVLNPSPDNYSGQSWSNTGDRKIVKSTLTASNMMAWNKNPFVKAKGKLTSQQSSYAGKASFSPDGKKVAYEADRKDVNTKIYDIYVLDVDGNNTINLTNSLSTPGQGQFNDWPAWSPDGKKISFVSDRDGKPLDFGLTFKNAWQIYTIDADGSNVTRIINNNYADGSPSWGRVPDDLAEKLKEPPQPTLTITPESTISALDLEQINQYYGKEVAIEGKVVEYGSSWDVETRPLLLYFNNPNQHCNSYDAWKQGACGTDFRVVITKEDLKIFPDVFTYLDKDVRVVGKIEYYKGAPCIFATDPQQITIVK